jgi:glycosyltransferase involved in cell wall biosynthesis
MSKDKPLVSVLLATYNGGRFIRRAIQSVFNQTFSNCELIVIDDCSNDGTFEILKEFENEERVIRLRNEVNLGYQKSLNRGMREARGEYIAIIDDDDRWLDEDKLKKQVEFLASHPEYVLVGADRVIVDEDGSELARPSLPKSDEEIRGKMLERNCFAHSSVMYRKSAAVKVGCYRESRYPYSEDYDLWVRLGTIGKLANLPIYGGGYTVRGRKVGYNFRLRFIPAVRSMVLISHYKNKYPHYWRAIRRRSAEIIDMLLHIISDVPLFVYLKRFLKSKCPTCWRTITRVHGAVVQGISGVIRLPSGKG